MTSMLAKLHHHFGAKPKPELQKQDTPPAGPRELPPEEFKRKRDYVLSFGHIAELLSTQIDFANGKFVNELEFKVPADATVFPFLLGDYAAYLTLKVAKVGDSNDRNPAVEAQQRFGLELTAGNYVLTLRAPGKLADLSTTVRVVIAGLDKSKTAAARAKWQRQVDAERQEFLDKHNEMNKELTQHSLDLLMDLDLPGLKSLLSCAEIGTYLSDLHNADWRREQYRERVIATIADFVPVLPVAKMICSYARPEGAPPELRRLMVSGEGDSVKQEEAAMFRSRGGCQIMLRADGSARLVDSGPMTPKYFEGAFTAEMFEKPRETEWRTKVFGVLRLNLLYLDFEAAKHRERVKPLPAGDQKERKQEEKLVAQWRNDTFDILDNWQGLRSRGESSNSWNNWWSQDFEFIQGLSPKTNARYFQFSPPPFPMVQHLLPWSLAL